MGSRNTRKYDTPVFCAGWAQAETGQGHVICGGGGGDGATGVRNLLVVAQYDSDSKELSEPLHTLFTDDDTAFAMAVHPNGREFMCSFTANKRHKGKLKLLSLSSGKNLSLEHVDRKLEPLQDIGEQRTLTFNTDGKLFATGGEDGHLRVFKWPSLELVLDRPDAHRSIKDLDFSLDGAFLAATDDVGPSRVWDLKEGSPAAALPLNKAGYCRFSRDGAKPCLYVTSAEDSKGYMTIWNTNWRRIGSKKVQDEPISAFTISSDGKLLAIGSSEGHITILNASKLSVIQRIKKAHMVFITALDFSPDNRLLLSASGDSSVRVTTCEASNRGWRILLILWIILIATVLSLVLSRGLGRGPSESLETVSSTHSSDTSHDMI